jgi:hypothetical protein
MKELSLQAQAIAIGQIIVDTAAQDVVHRHDFLDIESILHPLAG